MNTHELIFVFVPGRNCVMGFEPGEIVEFEKDLARMRRRINDIDYWNYFSFYFSEPLDGHKAWGFSASWHFDPAWKELDRLRREAGIRK